MMEKHGLEDEKLLQVSIGIPAYNEEGTIGEMLGRILAQRLKNLLIKEILVVSESADHTNEIVEKISNQDARVRLVKSEKRLGLSGALNLFIRKATSPILVIIDADTFLEPDTVENLVKPLAFEDGVGGTSGQKVPITRSPIVRAFWELHHEFCCVTPKMCSSIIALRNGIVKEIPLTCGVPDTYIAHCIQREGLRVVYVPDAVGSVIEPNSFKKHIKQRKRIYIQHLALKRETNVTPPALRPSLYLKALCKALTRNPMFMLAYIGCIFDEVVARFLGLFEFKRNSGNYQIWEKVR